MIGWLMQRGIEPHVPLLDREHQTHGFFTRADFAFDTENNVFICPGRKHLRSTGLVRPDGTMPYWASTTDCRACSLRLRRAKGIVTRIHAATSRDENNCERPSRRDAGRRGEAAPDLFPAYAMA